MTTPRLHITPPPWTQLPELEPLDAALRRNGGTWRFAGGCVRDALLAQPVHDFDIATPLPPLETIARLQAAKIRALPTGLQHGVITAVIAGRCFEIATLRRDVATDGRHARVAFTADWRQDAQRRDFTLNALFMEQGGVIIDFCGGIADARAGRIRFVGDPEQRLAEDYLRLLRLFRFYAWYGRSALDPDTLAACAAASPSLRRLAAERIRSELLRLLAAPDPTPALTALTACGAFAWLSSAGTIPVTALDLERVRRLTALERQYGRTADPLRRLAALWPRAALDAVETHGQALRLSRAEQRRLQILLCPAQLFGETGFFRWYEATGPALATDAALLAAAVTPSRDPAPTVAFTAATGTPRFPLSGRDALDAGLARGPAVGQTLHAVRQWWAENGFSPDHAACLERLRTLASRPHSAR